MGAALAKRIVSLSLAVFLASSAGLGWSRAAGAEGTLRIGVLKFGTVNWELDVVKTHGLAEAQGVKIDILGLASKNATAIALQAGEVDMVVTDWIWVSRQRAEGAGFTFVPYSTAAGGVMVPADSPLQSLADLKGKRLGIAGGPLDKSWLLLRALTGRRHGFDADTAIEKVFGAPPLLNQEILAGRLDAVLNFWHYAARLEAAGLRRLAGVDEIARALGIESKIPLIGYVFDEQWAASHRDEVLGFLRASQKAKALLAESDAEWERLRPLMRTEDDTTFRALRDSYRRGIPQSWGQAERDEAEELFAILAAQGGEALVGRSKVLQKGTFWPDFTF